MPPNLWYHRNGTESESQSGESHQSVLPRRELLKTGAAAGLSLIGITKSGVGRAQTGGGTEQWRFQTDDDVSSSPTVVDGTVYVGSDYGNLYALTADDGTEQWRFKMGDGVGSAAMVVGGTVYAGDGESNLYALAADNGTEQWRFQTGSGTTSPTVVSGTVYVGDYDGNVYALNADDGTEQWRSQIGSNVHSLAVANGTVYAGGNDTPLSALAADDGTTRWRSQVGRGAASVPTVANDTIYVGSDDRNVYALAADDGSEKWRFETDGIVWATPTVLDSTVYVGGEGAELHALTANDGTEQWSFDTGSFIVSSPTVANGTVYAGCLNNNVYAVAASDGTEKWRFNTDGQVLSSPTVADGTVYVGSDDGNVYALDAGVDGSSEDSRALLGTHGHHDYLDFNRDGDPDNSKQSLLEIVATEQGEISYEVVVEGTAEKTTVSEKIKSKPNGNDRIRQRDNDTVIIEGYTGNAGYGDAYLIDGEIVDFKRIDGDADVAIRLDGETVSPSEFSDDSAEDGSSLLEIVATEDGEIRYEVVVEGTAEKTTVSEKIKSESGGNDQIRRLDSNTVVIQGYTGNTGYGDAYRIDGKIVEFRRIDGNVDVDIRLDGEPVSPSEFSDDSSDSSSLLEIIATEQGEISYEVVVEGTAEKTTVSEKIKSELSGNDQIKRLDSNTVVIEGYTGNTGYGDAYLIDGEIIEYRRVDGNVAVEIRLDGESVSPDQL